MSLTRRPRQPSRYHCRADARTTQQGNVRLHSVAGQIAAVVLLAGEPFCAITDHPRGGLMAVFAEDLP